MMRDRQKCREAGEMNLFCLMLLLSQQIKAVTLASLSASSRVTHEMLLLLLFIMLFLPIGSSSETTLFFFSYYRKKVGGER